MFFCSSFALKLILAKSANRKLSETQNNQRLNCCNFAVGSFIFVVIVVVVACFLINLINHFPIVYVYLLSLIDVFVFIL